ncbi:MAG TPA: DUF6242 domain-containing protein [Paludibacteraceae bacterium]|nr:DUF6242 domain-containing protein [Paludibacteraceae bacterium]HPH63166.1 DUF6242 domain-containing protein [Paludibacteraceae bacterium]
MKNRFLWLSLVLLPLTFGTITSCSDDDDEEVPYNNDDPRVSSMTIEGISQTFIVNDVECRIYNYDSLSFGANLEAIHPVFYGYSGYSIMQYDSAGTWENYPNDTSFKLNFTKPIKFRSISLDSASFKDYSVEIRVHKYDVEAYEWEKLSSLSVHGTVTSQKAVYYNKTYYYFYSNEAGENYALTSTDCKTWTELGSIVLSGADWSTLTERNGSLVVNTTNGLYVYTSGLSFASSSFLMPVGFTLARPLFMLGGKFWVIAKNEEDKYYLCYIYSEALAYSLVSEIPSSFNAEDMEIAVCTSGSTMVGYLFTKNEDGGTIVWALDVDGNLLDLSNGKSPFEFRKGMMAYQYEKSLCVIGGEDTEGNIQSSAYKSINSGINWGFDSHKIFPNANDARAFSTILFNEETNEVFLIGGNNKSGFAPEVWKGILKQFLMDDLVYGKE